MKSFVWRSLSVLTLLSWLLMGQGARPAYAAAYVVNSTADTITNDGNCTLREAIESANNAGNGDCGQNSAANDTITFSVSGTITLTATLPNIVSGAGTLTIDGTGQTITISGNNSVRVMIVNSGANLTLQNLTIANGRAASGGGIYNAGTLTVTGSTFQSNSAGDGGGIFNAGGTLTVTNSTFSNNSAGGSGGGIYNAGSTLTVTGSTFSANSAAIDGGGIYNAGGTLTVTNSTFSGNSADLGGGGIFNAVGGTATLTNTIIANSTGGDCVGGLSGSNINNLIESTGPSACGLTSSGNNIIGVDPNLGTLTGSPAYFPLLPGSPAIDAGDDTTCQNPPVSNQSQNGVLRPQDGDGNGSAVCDIGAYEAIWRVFLPLVSR